MDLAFGFDFFVSYSWADGGTYAEKLARELEALNFDVFLDRDDFAAGDNWKSTSAWSLRRTSKLILVGTEQALNSEPVRHELEIFSETGRTVIPINLGGALDDVQAPHPWAPYLEADKLRIEEPQPQLCNGPEPSTVARIAQTFGLLRQDEKRVRALSVIATLLALAAIVSIVFFLQADEAKSEALASAKDALLARDAARESEATAIEKTAETTAALKRAEIEQKKAEEQTRIAVAAQEKAEEERIKAEQQTRLAVAAREAESKALDAQRLATREANNRTAQAYGLLAHFYSETDPTLAIAVAQQAGTFGESALADFALVKAYNSGSWLYTKSWSSGRRAELSPLGDFVVFYIENDKELALYNTASGEEINFQVDEYKGNFKFVSVDGVGRVYFTTEYLLDRSENRMSFERRTKSSLTIYNDYDQNSVGTREFDGTVRIRHCSQRTEVYTESVVVSYDVDSGENFRSDASVESPFCGGYDPRAAINAAFDLTELDRVELVEQFSFDEGYYALVSEAAGSDGLDPQLRIVKWLPDGQPQARQYSLDEFDVVDTEQVFAEKLQQSEPGSGSEYTLSELVSGRNLDSRGELVNAQYLSDGVLMLLVRVPSDGTYAIYLNFETLKGSIEKGRNGLQPEPDQIFFDDKMNFTILDKGGEIHIYDRQFRPKGRVLFPDVDGNGYRRSELPEIRFSTNGSKILAGSKDHGYYMFEDVLNASFSAMADGFAGQRPGDRIATSFVEICPNEQALSQRQKREILVCIEWMGMSDTISTGIYAYVFERPQLVYRYSESDDGLELGLVFEVADDSRAARFVRPIQLDMSFIKARLTDLGNRLPDPELIEIEGLVLQDTSSKLDR